MAETKRRRRSRPVTRERLERAALHYLERYASSAANLRRVLGRRVARSAQLHGTDADEGAALADAIVAKFTDRGLLDDAAYAEARARSLLRQGRGPRRIAAMLHQKGVPGELIERALATLADAHADPEFAAACRHAQRRRLGPFGPPAGRADRRERELASLGRVGFSYEVARRVVEAASAEALEADLAVGRDLELGGI